MYIIHVHILTSVPPEFLPPARRLLLSAPRTAPGRASEWVDPGRNWRHPKIHEIGIDLQWIYSDL